MRLLERLETEGHDATSLRQAFAKLKIPSEQEAERRVLQFVLDDKARGLLAHEAVEVADLFRISREVSDFAKPGDYIWTVQFILSECK